LRKGLQPSSKRAAGASGIRSATCTFAAGRLHADYEDRYYCNPMFTVIDDTCGFHDTIGGCCSSALNRKRYGKPDDPS
jgi:uncharacterized protein YcgI (DUF1989 family)